MVTIQRNLFIAFYVPRKNVFTVFFYFMLHYNFQYLQPNGNNWRWFDDRSGRWCSYSASNNSTIDSAWKAGESSVRFTAGRRRYTVQFNTMVQVSVATVETVCVKSVF